MTSTRVGAGKILLMHPSSPVLSGYEITRNVGVSPAGAFDIHGKATRKRTYVSSNPVPRVLVVDDERVLGEVLQLLAGGAPPFEVGKIINDTVTTYAV